MKAVNFPIKLQVNGTEIMKAVNFPIKIKVNGTEIMKAVDFPTGIQVNGQEIMEIAQIPGGMEKCRGIFRATGEMKKEDFKATGQTTTVGLAENLDIGPSTAREENSKEEGNTQR